MENSETNNQCVVDTPVAKDSNVSSVQEANNKEIVENKKSPSTIEYVVDASTVAFSC